MFLKKYKSELGVVNKKKKQSKKILIETDKDGALKWAITFPNEKVRYYFEQPDGTEENVIFTKDKDSE